MLHRSHTKRSFRAVIALLLALGVWIGVFAGCQSNSDRDLIARDRRMQEDQIYALQDYVNQYQRLLCKYRSENATLRRQLSENYPVESPAAEQTPALHSRLIPTPKDSPQFKAPATPGVKQQPTPPLTAPPAIETPDVPPLKTSTDAAPPAITDYADAGSDEGPAAPVILPSSYEARAKNDQPRANSRSAAASPLQPANSSTTAMLTGEVIANGKRGPRLKIDVMPADQSQPFVGTASLMLLGVNEAGEQHSLGRWNYSASDVRAAHDMASPDPTMHYFIELPASTPLNEPTQLWLRLVPQAGEKVLTHANVNLASPGLFSSSTIPNRIQDVDIVATSYTEETAAPTTTQTADIQVEMNGTPWATALPGKPANLSPEVRDGSGAGGWRASTEPMPDAPAAVAKARLTPPGQAVARHELPAKPPAKESPAKPRGWSPERSGDSPQNVAAKPSWSATR